MPLTNAEKQAAWQQRRKTLAKSAEALHEAVERAAAARDPLAAQALGETPTATAQNLARHFETTAQQQPAAPAPDS
jgi:hypothetical protein